MVLARRVSLPLRLNSAGIGTSGDAKDDCLLRKSVDNGAFVFDTLELDGERGRCARMSSVPLRASAPVIDMRCSLRVDSVEFALFISK